MDITKLIRNAKAVNSTLKELPNGSVVTAKGCKIYVPVRYIERGLAQLGTDAYILGIYAITLDDQYYGVSLVNAMIPISPSTTNRIKLDGDDYLEFVFSPGATVFRSTDLVKMDTLIYKIYDEFLALGHIPWFMKYEELGHIFDTAKEFAGANIGTNHEVTQLICSILARDPKDRTKYYRTIVNSQEELVTNPPVFVPLKSVQYAATNTTTKLGGSYFSAGVVSALIDPSSRTERIEDLLLR